MLKNKPAVDSTSMLKAVCFSVTSGTQHTPFNIVHQGLFYFQVVFLKKLTYIKMTFL